MAPQAYAYGQDAQHAQSKVELELLRAGAGSYTEWVAPLYGRDAAAEGSQTDLATYLGLGLGVGGALLVAFVALVVLTVRRRAKHKALLEVLEVEEAVQGAHKHQVAEIPRPAAALRCSTMVPLQSRAGWDALVSDDTIDDPEAAPKKVGRKRLSVTIPTKLKQQGLPLARLKRLTAIMESPKSKRSNSPAVAVQEPALTDEVTEVSVVAQHSSKAYTLREVHEDDVYACSESPKLHVQPSFAIRSQSSHVLGRAITKAPKVPRSQSIGTLIPIPDNAILGQTVRISRASIHARSISLGGPPTRPPSGPVPPLPVIEPHAVGTRYQAQSGLGITHSSSSSQASASSSVLVASPVVVQVGEQKSPSLEEVVAQGDNASIKNVTKSQWQNPLVVGPRPATAASTKLAAGLRSQGSIRSNIARYSAEESSSKRVSATSMTSSNSLEQALSEAQIKRTTSQRLDRISSNDALHRGTGGTSAIQKPTTPRRASRTSVSIFGSPAEPKRPSSSSGGNGVLRDISSTSILTNSKPPLSRGSSNATQDSGRSSDTNPFQWDNSKSPILSKPSALKGSPNARKGHKRQNTVRISLLTPQILGPPPSRPTSAGIMHGIEEEQEAGGDGKEEASARPGTRFVSNQRLSRPLSAASSAPSLRLRPLRASYAPSSPTLSTWTAYNEHDLPSQPSNSQLSVSQLSASPTARTGSRLSNRSSVFSIPAFPSPTKQLPPTTRLSRPVPEFYLSRPSTDIAEDDDDDEDIPPVSHPRCLDVEMPSSPPLPTSKVYEYDPAHPPWSTVDLAAPQSAHEYDPASPACDDLQAERSSAFFPFATTSPDKRLADDNASPGSKPSCHGGDMLSTPPLSPELMSSAFEAFFNGRDAPPRAAEMLTSENASSIMAHLPMIQTVDFPGAPVLSPPESSQQDFYAVSTSHSDRKPSLSNPMRFQPLRPAPVPPRSSDVPSPLHISGKTSPRGPRSQPGNSVLKNAMALRRMNSEVDNTLEASRESRRYARLGREASPLLPWMGNPEFNDERAADMHGFFDFDFASGDAASGAEEHESTNALDDVDILEIERKLDGALYGFSAAREEELGSDPRTSSSVWEDGERFWSSPREDVLASSPLPVEAFPQSELPGLGLLATPRSIR